MPTGNLARVLVDYPTISVPSEGAQNQLRKRNALLSFLFDTLLILMISAPMLFWNLGEFSLGVPDEIYEAGAGIEMSQTGSWFTPTVQGRTFFDKPPLKMWLTAAVSKLFGTSNFTYRSIDAVAGIRTLLLTYYLAQMLFASRLIGLFAVFSFLGSRIFVLEHGMRTAVQDSVLVFFCTALMVCAWRMLIVSRAITHPRAQPQLRKLGPLAGLLFGCAMMTKSAGALMPVLVFGLFLLLSGQIFHFIAATWKQLLVGLLIATVVGGTYFIGHCYFTPGACYSLITHHVIDRFTVGIHDVSGPDFFLIRIFQHRASFPPELLTLSVLVGLYSWLFGRDNRYCLLCVWSVLPVVLYSYAGTKFSWYIAPAFPAMAVLIATTVVSCGRIAYGRLQNWWNGSARLNLATILLAGICLYGIGASIHLYGTNLQRVSAMTTRIPADLAVADIFRAEKTLGRKPRILTYQRPKPTIHEWAYFQMLNPYSTIIEGKEAFAQQLSGDAPDFLVTGLHTISSIPKEWAIKSYTYLPPLYSRSNWISILSFVETDTIEHFTPWKKVINFGTRDFSPMYGFGGPEKFGGMKVRWMLGKDGAISIPGDAALHLLGAKIFLNFSAQIANDANVAVLNVSINEQIVAKLSATPNMLDTEGFVVPPRLLRSNENTLRFELDAGDTEIGRAERSVMFNWISIRLNQQ